MTEKIVLKTNLTFLANGIHVIDSLKLFALKYIKFRTKSIEENRFVVFLSTWGGREGGVGRVCEKLYFSIF